MRVYLQASTCLTSFHTALITLSFSLAFQSLSQAQQYPTIPLPSFLLFLPYLSKAEIITANNVSFFFYHYAILVHQQ